jgi:formate hydrogenlyase subunit 6/NADH:ubiquinone oxidoreductase subunit I
LRWPKLRELKEAVTAVFTPRFTTRFPKVPCQVPEKFRGKPEFDLDECIGCGACVNVCPTEALIQYEETESNYPTRKIVLRYDTCIFCGNCHDCCTTEKGINLSKQWDLATLDRGSTAETHQFELQRCEKCGHIIGTKKHLVWLYEKMGPLAYANPSILLAKSGNLLSGLSARPKAAGKADSQQQYIPPETEQQAAQTSDFMRILCPKCKFELNIRL